MRKETYLIMGMPVTIQIDDLTIPTTAFDEAVVYFRYVDETFSTYKDTSEIMKINRGELKIEDASDDMKEVFKLSEETRQESGGHFNIKKPDGSYDPSGLVKGWAIHNAAELLSRLGCKEFFIDAGGDIEARGRHWNIGIKNPFKQEEIIKVVYIKDRGIATSGSYIRGDHIYNPHDAGAIEEIVSLTVIGPNVYEADRFATAAFAMGKKGIEFIEHHPGLQGYMIDKKGIATMTTGFEGFTKNPKDINV